jgi:hypothetical protein
MLGFLKTATVTVATGAGYDPETLRSSESWIGAVGANLAAAGSMRMS